MARGVTDAAGPRCALVSSGPMTRIFSPRDQRAFATLSGDFNPIHVDPVAARRLLVGKPVVHGVHGLLWALDRALAAALLAGPVKLTELRAAFRKAILVNEPVELRVVGEGLRRKLDLTADGAKVATISVAWEAGDGASAGRGIRDAAPPRTECRVRAAADLGSVSGRLPLFLDKTAAAELFPYALRLLPPAQLAGILAATRLAGMEAPGLHSLLSGIDLLTGESGGSSELVYRTAGFDERMSRLTLTVDSPGFTGEVSSILRPPPARQTPVSELMPLIRPGEFAGRRALIIGGSRGLGEAAVKLLAGGGADVRFTYHTGRGDAEALVAELGASGREAACFAYDCSTDAPKLAAVLGGWAPDVMCYFATPFISASPAGRFSRNLFEQFCRCYVDGLQQAFLAVRSLSPRLRDVIAPSTIYVEDPPANLGEYAAAKSAAETLCRVLAKTHKGVRFHAPRLPRLATDQTSGLLGREEADPALALLPLLRGMQGSPSRQEPCTKG
ncbi:MAG: SDR family NAD(P)-dependent oxidoreductase [Elusimicrobiota bacterium]